MEYWDIYDEDGVFTGRKIEKHTPLKEGEYHIAIEAWIINSNKEILIQKRSDKCEILPSFWALTTGRAIAGETSMQCCLREISEELGLKISSDQVILIRRVNRKDGRHIIWDVYLVKCDTPLFALHLQESEVEDAVFVTFEEFRSYMALPNFFAYPEMDDVLAEIAKKVACAP